MKKKQTILLTVILVTLVLDALLKGPLTSQALKLVGGSFSGNAKISYSIIDFPKSWQKSFNPEIPSNGIVYKKELKITGNINQEVLVNKMYQLSGEIDTSFVSDWYSNQSELLIESNDNHKGQLTVQEIFYYTK